MFHASIRNEHYAVHFVGEVNAYNLETLEQHARGMAGAVLLHIEVDPADETALVRNRRMAGLANLAGVSIKVVPAAVKGRFSRRIHADPEATGGAAAAGV